MNTLSHLGLGKRNSTGELTREATGVEVLVSCQQTAGLSSHLLWVPRESDWWPVLFSLQVPGFFFLGRKVSVGMYGAEHLNPTILSLVQAGCINKAWGAGSGAHPVSGISIFSFLFITSPWWSQRWAIILSVQLERAKEDREAGHLKKHPSKCQLPGSNGSSEGDFSALQICHFSLLWYCGRGFRAVLDEIWLSRKRSQLLNVMF